MTTHIKAQHTPGPWTLEDLTKGLDEAFQQPCLLVKGFNENAKSAHIIAAIEYWPNLKQELRERANARLIAAAPELLDACLGMVETLTGNDAVWAKLTIQQRARAFTMKAAIAKAKGEKQ